MNRALHLIAALVLFVSGASCGLWIDIEPPILRFSVIMAFAVFSGYLSGKVLFILLSRKTTE